MLNSNNLSCYFSLNKSFIEVCAHLGYLASSIIDQNVLKLLKTTDSLERATKYKKHTLNFIIDPPETINVITMFEKLDKVLNSLTPEKGEDYDLSAWAKLFDIYCNYGHANNQALELLGENKSGAWKPFKNSYRWKKDHWKTIRYGLIPGIVTIHRLCHEISHSPLILNFDALNNPLYFKD